MFLVVLFLSKKWFLFFLLLYIVFYYEIVCYGLNWKIKFNFEINECKYLLYIFNICKIYFKYLINEYVVGYIIFNYKIIGVNIFKDYWIYIFKKCFKYDF